MTNLRRFSLLFNGLRTVLSAAIEGIFADR